MTVTFFGHSNTPQDIQPKLKKVLIDLIEEQNASLFYVGNHGSFDRMARNTLKQLKVLYPHIHYAVVLAYMPGEKDRYNPTDTSDTLYPEGLEKTPPRYAISMRNRWMIDKSDYVVSYVRYSTGGAAQFKKLAQRKGRTVLNLFDSTEEQKYYEND